MGRTVATLVCWGLVLSGCSGTQGPPADPSSPVADSTQATSGSGDSTDSTQATAQPADPSGAAHSSTAPADPTGSSAEAGLAPGFDLGSLEGALREQTQWVLEHLTAGATGPDAAEVSDRFGTEFLQAVPADQIEPVLSGFREGPALTLTAVGPVTERDGGAQGVELTLSGEQALRLSVGVGPDGLIDALRIQPGPPQDLPELGSWGELDEEFAALGGTTSVFVGEVSGGSCTPVHSTAPEVPAPSGSVFKLIVLSAVADAVEEGALAWDDELTITSQVKSLPSGELQDRPDDSTVSVREAATLMISISDNTATDLLMAAVGPERLATVVDKVSDEPERLTPLLSTQQFFLLGWDATSLREQWADADPAERTALLQELPSDLSALRGNPFAVSDPAWPEGVGWFLTGQEICATHALLQEQAQIASGEPLRQILCANPGLPRPDGVTYQGFKGGSAPGVLAYTFYVETTPRDAEGAPDGGEGDVTGGVLSVQVSHTGAILPENYTVLTQSGLALLVQE